jgi:exopolysaccharide biosynthesis protein
MLVRNGRLLQTPTNDSYYAVLGVTNAGAGTWLANHLHPKDKISVTEQISPDNNLLQAVGGGPVVLKHGVLYNDPHPPVPGDVAIRNPITAIGVSKDRTHAMLAVFDGRQMGPWKSVGMTYREAAIYMQAHGAYNAMLFDTGGSSELVTRLPGQKKVSIINTPSDGQERPIANGLFVYETGMTSTTTLSCKPCRDDIITV